MYYYEIEIRNNFKDKVIYEYLYFREKEKACNYFRKLRELYKISYNGYTVYRQYKNHVNYLTDDEIINNKNIYFDMFCNGKHIYFRVHEKYIDFQD